ncbi:DUF2381 family protein [Archangium sp.]|uniref:DUF2381 family protein n=1 Tax=Archangium sp. TaxID=1872627 RepID=UPI00389A76F2
MISPLLILALLHTAPDAQPTAACQDVQRIELSLTHGAAQEICVSSGLFTGFVFDARVVIDVEDEVRFAEVTRGNTSVSLMPPGDGVEGEHFRLLARFPDGASVTFLLVVHRGRATRQVEVYRDRRTLESYQHEVAQEQARNQQLQEENAALRQQLEQLRTEYGDPRGLRRLIASNSLSKAGIRALQLNQEIIRHTEGTLTATRGVAYRSELRVAIEVSLTNEGTEPWSASVATLVDAQGEALTGIRLWLEGGSIPPHESRRVVVEADAKPGEHQGEVTLMLREDGPRSITIPGVALPR